MIDGLIAKQPAAFEQLYRENKAALERMVTKNSGNKEDAEDLIQESVLILYKKLQTEGFELNSTIGTFLYGIAKRVWLRKLKSNSKKWVTSDDNMQLSVGDDKEEEELQISRMHLYRKHLGKLGADCQKILRLFFDNFSMEEIASRMGYTSAGYAKKKKYKCKNKLIELIKADPLFKELRS